MIMIVAGVCGKGRIRERTRLETGLMLVYSTLLLLVLVLGSPFWLLRMGVSGRYRAGLSGRLGRVPADLREAVRGREVVWLHAVSVGEVMAAVEVVKGLAKLRPGLVVAVSTTTQTGQELARKRLAGTPVFYLPLDFRYAVRRYLKVLRPRLLVLMESELWPNLLRECGGAGVPVAVVNARVSDRSYPRYMRLRRMWRPLLARVSMFLAQGEETAERLLAIGVDGERVRVVGNLKYDVRAVAEGEMAGRLRARLPDGAKVVVCGSTLEGEEELLLAAWRAVLAAAPEALMVLAPRHPERFGRVVEMVRGTGLGGLRASAMGEIQRLEPGCVVVLDTIGDLPAVYSLAAVAFVGGSLVAAGGHNPLEPARFGVPVVIGSNFNNFREVVERMRAMDGIRVVSPEQMPAMLRNLLRDEAGAAALGERGRAVFAEQAGATERTVQELARMLGNAGAELRQ